MIKDDKIVRHSFAENDATKRNDVLTKEGTLSANRMLEMHQRLKKRLIPPRGDHTMRDE